MKMPLSHGGLITFTSAICVLIASTVPTAGPPPTLADLSQLPVHEVPAVSGDFFTAFAHATR